jgi:hypothetical protein
MGAAMPWHHLPAYCFGGAFLSNFVPHFAAGVLGLRFHTPFANPPFRGLSSPTVNVLWALFNLVVAYSLLVLVGNFELHHVADAVLAGTGFAFGGINISRSLGRMRGGAVPGNTGSEVA